MCEKCAENKPTAHIQRAGPQYANMIGQIGQLVTIFGSAIDREF